jgi:hypothetical protein
MSLRSPNVRDDVYDPLDGAKAAFAIDPRKKLLGGLLD